MNSGSGEMGRLGERALLPPFASASPEKPMLGTSIKLKTNSQDCLEANQTARDLSPMFFLDPPEAGHICGAK